MQIDITFYTIYILSRSLFFFSLCYYNIITRLIFYIYVALIYNNNVR